MRLWVAGEPLVDAGHPDQEQAQGGSVESVAQVFQGGRAESVSFIDNEQVDVARLRADHLLVGADVLIDADVYAREQLVEITVELAQRRGRRGGVEHGAGPG